MGDFSYKSRPSLYGRSGEYYLKVVDCFKETSSNVYTYRLKDGDGRIYTVESPKRFWIGVLVRCKLSIKKDTNGMSISARILKQPGNQGSSNESHNSKKTESLDSLSPVSPVGTLHSYSRNYSSYNQEKMALEIFDKMRDYGFHKCGKEFVCSCCGESYAKNQGIKCDTRELYLCNGCRNGQRKYVRQSKSIHAISIPMGGKNK